MGFLDLFLLSGCQTRHQTQTHTKGTPMSKVGKWIYARGWFSDRAHLRWAAFRREFTPPPIKQARSTRDGLILWTCWWFGMLWMVLCAVVAFFVWGLGWHRSGVWTVFECACFFVGVVLAGLAINIRLKEQRSRKHGP